MKRHTKILSTIFALTLLVTFPVGTAFAAEYPLQAGKDGTVIGTVTIDNDGTNLTVVFAIDDDLNTNDDYHLLKTHILATPDNKLKGALATGSPGQFPFEHFPLADSKTDTFTISLAGDLGVDPGTELIVAFHANVQNTNDIIGYMDSNGEINDEPGADCPTLEDIAAALPEYTTMQLFGDGSGYYDVRIDLNGDDAFGADESFDWYCIDRTHTIGLGVYTVRVFSSYEALPDEIINNGTGDNNVDHPENMDLVNWVINNPGNPVIISQVQQQDVIWALVDDAVTRDNLDSAEQQVYDAAVANGEDFEPADGQNLAIVLQPVDASDNSVGQVTIGQVTIGQVTFGSLGLECDPWDEVFKGDTAWAITEGGIDFPRSKNWGAYYNYTL
jgi:hypothetical protein